MLTARSVIVTIVAVALLSVLTTVFSLLGSGQNHSTLGRDTYGTRTEGYRAVHDLLDALDFETERILLPIAPERTLETSYVLWNPRNSLVQTEPAYFQVLADWVREGGYLVVAPSVESEDSEDSTCRQCSATKGCLPISLLQELGLAEVAIEAIDWIDPGAQKNRPKNRSGKGKRVSDNSLDEASETDFEANFEDWREEIRDVFRIQQRPSAVYSIGGEGAWEPLNLLATRVDLPNDQAWEVQYGELEPLARITIDLSETTPELPKTPPHTLAALFSLGKGQIAVFSNPFLASNAYLSHMDNSVLLAHLLTGQRKRVIFDGFYHGHTVRGNALWLLTKRPYAAIAIAVLIVAGLWIWRQSLFLGPCRQEKPASRRSLSEYIEAMSRFLLQGREGPKYVLREVRDGVLWHFCRTLGLPAQQQNSLSQHPQGSVQRSEQLEQRGSTRTYSKTIIGLLSRRQPQIASQLQAALDRAEAVLENPSASKTEILQATRKVSDCLST